ncbi:MAG TPA: hypothetical protein DD405_01235 [Desulfobacteraceae bacterium]|nr:hypothetical protein [Desulfobacteraceae bacterium]
MGKHSAVGSARLEWELIDSLTEKRLFAGVDERAGAKYTGKFDQWKNGRTRKMPAITGEGSCKGG